MKTKRKIFDCVAMKNAIQAKIYAQTKDMDFEQYREYISARLRGSRFAGNIL